ncbi:MAG: hypothetical protein PHI48_10615 [Bacteroidales bacterium]|nr:hypothetical protein [Bacteroidales bacterium]
MKTSKRFVSLSMKNVLFILTILVFSLNAKAVPDSIFVGKAVKTVLRDTNLLKSLVADMKHPAFFVDGKKCFRFGDLPKNLSNLADQFDVDAIDSLCFNKGFYSKPYPSATPTIGAIKITFKKNAHPKLVPFDASDTRPSFIANGGNFFTWIESTGLYKDTVAVADLITVLFIIGKDGKVSKAKILADNPRYPESSAELLRLISTMPDWEPGKYKGKPVDVSFVDFFICTPKQLKGDDIAKQKRHSDSLKAIPFRMYTED